MPEDQRSSSLSAAFPISPSRQQTQQLAAALLVDSLSLMGIGMPSASFDAGALQKWLWDFEGDFCPLLEAALGQGAASKFSHFVRNLPPISNPGELEVPAILALRTRVQAVIGLLGQESCLDAATARWSVYRQAVFAHQALRGMTAADFDLHSVKVSHEILARHLRGQLRLGWRSGLTSADVRDVVIGRLLDVDSMFADFTGWAALARESSFGPDSRTPDVDDAAARRSISELVARQAKQRAGQIQRALSDVLALREMEHELIEDSLIDPFCHNLRIGSSEWFSLGSRGWLNLDSPFATDGDREPLTSDDWAEIQEVLKTIDRPADAESPPSADGPSTSSRKRREAVSYQPISPSRLFVTWRGAPHSAIEARRLLPPLVRATVRTAWLATLGDMEDMLEYFADQRYRTDNPELRGAAIRSDILGFDWSHPIGVHPEHFPVREWMKFVFAQATSEVDSSPEGHPFGINAVRMLSTADLVLREHPAQSFACSMSAVETCIGGKGEGLGDRVARRAARILVPGTSGRSQAIDVFKALYNVRSRVVHGDDCHVSIRQAAFMRYVSSCIVYSLAGFAKAAPRFGLLSSSDAIRKYLDDQSFSGAPLIGTEPSSFYARVCGSGHLQTTWVGQ